jgi:hypothetical protein
MSNTTVRGWAIQFNKNSFGLSPENGTTLNVEDLEPGKTAEAIVFVKSNTTESFSNQPPGDRLFFQVAVKNSVEVVYFSVPFVLNVVLIDQKVIGSMEQFLDFWRKFKEEKVGQYDCKFP